MTQSDQHIRDLKSDIALAGIWVDFCRFLLTLLKIDCPERCEYERRLDAATEARDEAVERLREVQVDG